MPKRISMHKHVKPGTVVETETGLYKVYEVFATYFTVVIGDNEPHILKYDEPMTVFGRVSDNLLPF